MKEMNGKGQKKKKRPIKLIDILVNERTYFDYIKYTSFCGVRILQRNKTNRLYVRRDLLWEHPQGGMEAKQSHDLLSAS